MSKTLVSTITDTFNAAGILGNSQDAVVQTVSARGEGSWIIHVREASAFLLFDIATLVLS